MQRMQQNRTPRKSRKNEKKKINKMENLKRLETIIEKQANYRNEQTLFWKKRKIDIETYKLINNINIEKEEKQYLKNYYINKIKYK